MYIKFSKWCKLTGTADIIMPQGEVDVIVGKIHKSMSYKKYENSNPSLVCAGYFLMLNMGNVTGYTGARHLIIVPVSHDQTSREHVIEDATKEYHLQNNAFTMYLQGYERHANGAKSRALEMAQKLVKIHSSISLLRSLGGEV